MASKTSSSLDVFLSDDEYSHQLQNMHSPAVSIYSKDLIGSPHTFCTQSDHGDEDDYSHIQLPACRKKMPPKPPVRTSSVMSDSPRSNLDHFFNEQVQSHSYGTLQHFHHHQKSRRKTWSPTGLKLSMSGHYLGFSRNCSSSEVIDNSQKVRKNACVIYEDEERGPPKLAPISGILPKSPSKGIIKPIAFKPVVINSSFINTNNKKSLLHEDYVTGSNCYGQSPNSGKMESEFSNSFLNGSTKHFLPPKADHIQSYVGTPSPCDSGVGELEAMLREKDAEINILREVMDKNERAIFQVYDERKKSWAKEINDLKVDYEQKIKILQKKAYKTEQVLSQQSYKSQQELKSALTYLEKVKIERDNLKKSVSAEERHSDLTSIHGRNSSQSFEYQILPEVADLQLKIDNLNSSLVKQDEDLHLLQFKLQEKECEITEREYELSRTFEEVISKTEEVKSLKANLQKVSGDSDIELMDSSFCSCDKEIQTELCTNMSPRSSVRIPSSSSCDIQSENSILCKEIQDLSEELQSKTELFEKEREQWKEEKNKVIRYQKQLQLNYLQMFNKNRMLEAEVEQLTLDLENRDLKLMAMNGGDESLC